MSLWKGILKAATPKSVPIRPTSDDLAARGVTVEVDGVGKAYQDFWAVRHVTFSVRRGECVGIVGYNGAGKSTLLQIIAGTLSPTEGTVRTSGRVVPLLELGAGFNGDLSGRENLYLAAALLGVSRQTLDQRMHELEAFAEIGGFIDKPVRTYSSGMIMRLAFSLLTQIEPDVMIIDEALAVGDAYFAHKCMRMIRRFREQGRSLLFVSHDASAVKTFCDRAILLERGSIVKQGAPEEVLDYYNAMIAAREHDAEIMQSVSSVNGRIVTRSGNQQANITRFDLLDEQGKPIRAVLSGSRARICCLVEFKAEVENPTIGFVIRDRLGNDVFGTNTFHLRQAVGTFRQSDRLETSFTVQMALGSGHYSITLAVHAGPDHREQNFDWCDNLIAFTVVPHGPLAFTGVAALEVAAETALAPKHLHRRCNWDEVISFSVAGSASRYQVSGWSVPEPTGCWTLGPESRLGFELPQARRMLLKAELIPFTGSGLPAQKLELWLGGNALGAWSLTTPKEIEVEISKEQLTTNSEFELLLRVPLACSPQSLGQGSDERVLGVMLRSLQWRKLS